MLNYCWVINYYFEYIWALLYSNYFGDYCRTIVEFKVDVLSIFKHCHRAVNLLVSMLLLGSWKPWAWWTRTDCNRLGNDDRRHIHNVAQIRVANTDNLPCSFIDFQISLRKWFRLLSSQQEKERKYIFL